MSEESEKAEIVSSGEVADTPATDGPRIVINPSTFRNEKDALCVAYNEAYRIIMELNGFDPTSEPTEEQRRFFADTAYANDEQMLRRTILARICTFDTSVEHPTSEQLEEAVEFLETVMEIGAPQNEEEQSIVQRTRDVLTRALEVSPEQRVEVSDAEEQPAEEQPAEEQPAEEQPAEEQPAEEQPAVQADIGGGTAGGIDATPEDMKEWDNILEPNPDERDAQNDYDTITNRDDLDSLDNRKNELSLRAQAVKDMEEGNQQYGEEERGQLIEELGEARERVEESLKNKLSEALADEKSMMEGDRPVGGEERGKIGERVLAAKAELNDFLNAQNTEAYTDKWNKGEESKQNEIDMDAVLNGSLDKGLTETVGGDLDTYLNNDTKVGRLDASQRDQLSNVRNYFDVSKPPTEDPSESLFGVLDYNSRRAIRNHSDLPGFLTQEDIDNG